MSKQPEAVLENNLVKQLTSLGYGNVSINDEAAILSNLKAQLEKFNKTTFSDKEFKAITNHLSKGNVFEKAKTLRDRFNLKRDDGKSFYVQFFDSDEWNKNLFQVTNQVTIDGIYKTRFDVTLLVNGLPLVQIELKRRGLELKEAFNQINRYQRHSFWTNSALFQYVQIFVISNGVNTKYYANNKKQSFKQTFCWADKNNRNINELSKFTETFLNVDHLGKMIAHYIVFNETNKVMMVLRPYQYYATEGIVNHVQKAETNGYIWHTTGSGKTLTSFKTAQIIMDLPEVAKVVFVVDRKDLDYQTMQEFNSYKDGSVDATSNTKSLIEQFNGTFVDKNNVKKDSKLIVTTIQKLNNAISGKGKNASGIEDLKEKRVIFIFDECHRSQFGATHKKITEFFVNSQLFGFTGTPIFADNASKNDLGKRTTKDLFGECLHKYVITDAIKDENVLRFSVEYLGRYKKASNTFIDIEVEDIDTKEVLDSEDRLAKITDYIIQHHNQKTHNREYSAIFAVSSIDTLIKYYELFQQRIKAGKTDLRVATIFTYGTNEDDDGANGMIEESYGMSMAAEGTAEYEKYSHSRDKLESFIADYNKLYGTGFSTRDSKSFDEFFKNLGRRLKEREKEGYPDKDRLDILLVVNMFLTGFDAKMVNTLYVDKNLKYHGLIQAFSRTNRIINEKKSHGNILCFRNLKKATDEALALFSNKDAKEVVLLPPFVEVQKKFAEAFAKLLSIAPIPASVDDLISEDDQLNFVQAFRRLIRLKNVLESFADFSWDDIPINEQAFEDYQSKYLDIREKVKSDHQKQKDSILNDVDFELELIQRDEINVAYILKLLAKLKNASAKDFNAQQDQLINMLAGDVKLRSKRELIEKFIKEQLPLISDSDNIPDEFEKFWQDQKVEALSKICEEEGLDKEQFKALIETYTYSEQEPLRDEVFKCLAERPSILQARTIGERIIGKMKEYVQVFFEGMQA